MDKGVVILLDALGIKGIWAREEAEWVVRRWSTILDWFKESIANVRDKPQLKGEANIIAFSDSIIITLSGSDPVELIPIMGGIVAPIFIGALGLGILFRGVISAGEFLFEESMIIGPAIDEAESWYTAGDWIGISTSPSANFILERRLAQGLKVDPLFLKYNVPLREGLGMPTLHTFALNWPILIKPSEDEKTKRASVLESFSQQVIGPEVVRKYENTLDFLEFCISATDRLPNPRMNSTV